MNGKHPLRSRTIWLNCGYLALAILAAPELHRLMGPDALAVVALIQTGLNLVLRKLTTQPLTTGTEPPPLALDRDPGKGKYQDPSRHPEDFSRTPDLDRWDRIQWGERSDGK